VTCASPILQSSDFYLGLMAFKVKGTFKGKKSNVIFLRHVLFLSHMRFGRKCICVIIFIPLQIHPGLKDGFEDKFEQFFWSRTWFDFLLVSCKQGLKN
jgi:hypothetical protein